MLTTECHAGGQSVVLFYVFSGEKMNFNIGELIIYGENGVCRVEGIEQRLFLGELTECYTLQPIYKSYVIYTPTSNVNVPMRPIISAEKAQSAIKDFNLITPKEMEYPSPRAATAAYTEIIKSLDFDKLIMLTVFLKAKQKRVQAEGKPFSAIDERFLKKSEELLAGEIAAALNISTAEALIALKA